MSLIFGLWGPGIVSPSQACVEVASLFFSIAIFVLFSYHIVTSALHATSKLLWREVYLEQYYYTIHIFYCYRISYCIIVEVSHCSIHSFGQSKLLQKFDQLYLNNRIFTMMFPRKN